VISSTITRVNALLLLLAGVVLLFASDRVLPNLVTGYPTSGIWLGQVLGAACLGFAALNWLQRNAVIGGIYGRPVVFANLVFYFVSAMSLLRLAVNTSRPVAVWWIAILFVLLAAIYAVLLMRGPFGSLDPPDQAK
jgi:hypothetical protein